MVEPIEMILPFVVPAVTGLIIFMTQWHKKGSQIEVSGIDITNMKKQMDNIDTKINKVIDKINEMNTDTEVFRYRLKVIERLVDSVGMDRDREYRAPFRPKDSNGE